MLDEQAEKFARHLNKTTPLSIEVTRLLVKRLIGAIEYSQAGMFDVFDILTINAKPIWQRSTNLQKLEKNKSAIKSMKTFSIAVKKAILKGLFR